MQYSFWLSSCLNDRCILLSRAPIPSKRLHIIRCIYPSSEFLVVFMMEQQYATAPRPVREVIEYLDDYPSPPRSIVARTIFQYLIDGNRTHRRTVDGKLEDRGAVLATWSSEDRRNVISFMHVDKCFYAAGREGLNNIFPNELPKPDWMNANCRILNMPEEVWSKIYKLLGYNKENLLPLWKRASLSVESFASAPPQPHDLDTGNSHISKFVNLLRPSTKELLVLTVTSRDWYVKGGRKSASRTNLLVCRYDFPTETFVCPLSATAYEDFLELTSL